MTRQRNPWDVPEWHALQREAKLVRHLLGSGVTALGKANYADKAGEYYTAFFGLSVGLERLAKLILVADYAISNNGRMPKQEVVKKFGHNLMDLANTVDKLCASRRLKLNYSRPADAISAKIIERLDVFADARRGRYANFGTVGDPNLSTEEPIRRWWDDVAELILDTHYRGTATQARVESNASIVDTLLSRNAAVLYVNETGNTMQDVLSASIRTGQTEIVHKYGRYYILTNVRWLAKVFNDLASEAVYTHNIEAFFGVWEHLETFTVDDSFLKKRKIWPLK